MAALLSGVTGFTRVVGGAIARADARHIDRHRRIPMLTRAVLRADTVQESLLPSRAVSCGSALEVLSLLMKQKATRSPWTQVVIGQGAPLASRPNSPAVSGDKALLQHSFASLRTRRDPFTVPRSAKHDISARISARAATASHRLVTHECCS